MTRRVTFMLVAATCLPLIAGVPQARAQASGQGVQDEVIVAGPQPEPVPQDPEATAAAEAPQIGGVSGRLAVNLASGSGNQQINGAVIAIGDVAIGSAAAHQTILSADPRDRATRIVIEGEAFARTSGMAGINIAAGSQNQMANLAAVAIGNHEALSDQLLSQSRASIEPSGSTGGTGDRNDSIQISDNAFRDSSGLIQVNLIGGERNSSSNIFVMSVLDEDFP